MTGWLLDTDAAIHLRDGSEDAVRRYRMFGSPAHISIMSQIELEGGLVGRPAFAERRRQAMQSLLARLVIVPVDQSTVRAYARILAATGFSRRRVIDRLIAAIALVHDLTLITMNGEDFRDIPGLRLEPWPAAQ